MPDSAATDTPAAPTAPDTSLESSLLEGPYDPAFQQQQQQQQCLSPAALALAAHVAWRNSNNETADSTNDDDDAYHSSVCAWLKQYQHNNNHHHHHHDNELLTRTIWSSLPTTLRHDFLLPTCQTMDGFLNLLQTCCSCCGHSNNGNNNNNSSDEGEDAALLVSTLLRPLCRTVRTLTFCQTVHLYNTTRRAWRRHEGEEWSDNDDNSSEEEEENDEPLSFGLNSLQQFRHCVANRERTGAVEALYNHDITNKNNAKNDSHLLWAAYALYGAGGDVPTALAATAQAMTVGRRQQQQQDQQEGLDDTNNDATTNDDLVRTVWADLHGRQPEQSNKSTGQQHQHWADAYRWNSGAVTPLADVAMQVANCYQKQQDEQDDSAEQQRHNHNKTVLELLRLGDDENHDMLMAAAAPPRKYSCLYQEALESQHIATTGHCHNMDNSDEYKRIHQELLRHEWAVRRGDTEQARTLEASLLAQLHGAVMHYAVIRDDLRRQQALDLARRGHWAAAKDLLRQDADNVEAQLQRAQVYLDESRPAGVPVYVLQWLKEVEMALTTAGSKGLKSEKDEKLASLSSIGTQKKTVGFNILQRACANVIRAQVHLRLGQRTRALELIPEVLPTLIASPIWLGRAYFVQASCCYHEHDETVADTVLLRHALQKAEQCWLRCQDVMLLRQVYSLAARSCLDWRQVASDRYMELMEGPVPNELWKLDAILI